MEWTVEKIEDVMNYMRVCLGAEKIFMLCLDEDKIGYWDNKDVCYRRSFSRIYQEMLDKQKEI